ncbi:hypothetical protein ACFY3U_17600 [Micromonospora sp. NPDC000089]|uniref:HAAS signaling domain-containing protein n=1 Tax=unclassified Micromonospora TaxID=2617518 RepID=UPI0036B7737C
MTVSGQEITRYVERVRAALADLPPQTRDELTEELPEHLAEVAAEGEGTLVERLGEPEAYAAELRAAAGPAVPSGGRRSVEQRIGAVVGRARARLSGVDASLGPILGYARASEFLRLLRPAWWVLRGYLAAMLLTAMTTAGGFGLLPRLDGNDVAGLVMLAGLVWASIWLGRRVEALRGWRRHAVQLTTVGLAIWGLVVVVGVDDRARWEGDFGYGPAAVQNPYDQVQDVFVYDGEGRLVENARLFDQNGTPINLGWPACDDPVPPTTPTHAYPYCPQNAPFRLRPTPTAPLPPGASPPATPAPSPGGPTAGADPGPTAPTAGPASTAPAPTPTG